MLAGTSIPETQAAMCDLMTLNAFKHAELEAMAQDQQIGPMCFVSMGLHDEPASDF